MKRCNPEDVVWFEAKPTYVLHWINAYEDGDEIILDGYSQDPVDEENGLKDYQTV